MIIIIHTQCTEGNNKHGVYSHLPHGVECEMSTSSALWIGSKKKRVLVLVLDHCRLSFTACLS